MTWVAPWFLAGLALVPAVFLWGLLVPRGRRIVVGSLLLWKRVFGGGPAGKPSARVRLTDPLLWLDAVLVLLVVLACARPAVRTSAAAEPVATVVVDSTASMTVGDRFARAKAMARAVLNRFGAAPVRERQVAGNDASPVFESEAGSALRDDVLRFFEPLLADGDAARVAAAEAAGRPDRPVLLATDAAPQEALPANLYVFACGAEPRNAGLVRVAARIEAAAWWLLVSARATPGTGARDLSVEGDGRRLAEVPRFLEPGQSSERVLAMPGRPPARLRVALGGPADDLGADDAACLVLSPGASLRVWLTGDPDDSLRRALTAAGAAVVEAPDGPGAPAQHPVEKPAGEADLVVACGSALPADWKGPAALVLPPDGAGPLRPTGDEALAEWRVAADHPLADALYLEPPRLGPVRRYALEPSAEVLLGTPDFPLIVTWQADGARRLAVLFALDEKATDWPARAGFPVFWRRAMEWLVPADRRVAEYRTYRPLEPMPGRIGRLASAGPGFFSDEVGEYGVSFIGSDESFQSGPRRDDAAAAVEAIRRSIESKRRAALEELWPYLAAAAVVALVARAWVTR
jgi:hypothetical protein